MSDLPLGSEDGLRERCARLRASLLRHGTATEAEIDPYVPGGEENRESVGLAPWIWYYAQLVRLMGRTEDGAPARDGSARVNDALLLAALGAQPELVEQETDDPEALAAVQAALDALAARRGRHTWAVHPKSFHTLLHLHARSERITWLTERSQVLLARGASDDLELLRRTREEIGYQHRVCAWVATTPGPGLPFGEHDARPALPDAVADLDSVTLAQILGASLRVNWVRLQALSELVTPSGGSGARPTWSAFFGALAVEHDERPETLMRDYSLAALLASQRLAASERTKAQREADLRARRAR